MKRAIVIFVFIIAIITYHNFIFASYNRDVIEEELHKRVELVFYERTKIWNNLLAGQYTSLPQLEKELKTIITNPLFISDMKIFKQMLSTPTSYEDICNISIRDICIIKNNSKRAVLQVLILWEVEGFENNYSEEIKYTVEMKKDKGKWLLSNYEIIK